jgi:hypothetical protein
VEKRHSAQSYRMMGKTWPKHCEIYLNASVLDDIVGWIRGKVWAR